MKKKKIINPLFFSLQTTSSKFSLYTATTTILGDSSCNGKRAGAASAWGLLSNPRSVWLTKSFVFPHDRGMSHANNFDLPKC